MNYLLDTCVVSDIISRHPSRQVKDWFDSVPETRLYISVITVGEIRKGIEQLPDSQRRSELEAWLHDRILPRFWQRLVPLDTTVILKWGVMVGRLERQGRPMPAMDSLIAASALHNGLTLATRNESDFAQTGVEVVNPWRA
jgi:tRNA(fMet)-specific endonuclease VapC